MRARGQASGAEAVGKARQPEMPAPGKRTLVEQAYNEPVAVAQQRVEQAAAHPATTGPAGGDTTKGPETSNAPAASYVIPFDRSPKSSPGEQIIFGAVFTDSKPDDYQLVYTCAGGDFNAAGSGTTSVKFPGIVKNNLYFFIDSKWDKKSAVSVKMELQKKADGSAVQTETWTFGAKTTIPTTVTQQEAETERNLPGVYSYKVGPDLNKDGKDDYIGQTVLETFGSNSSNLTIADVKPDYAKAHGLTTDQLVTNHFFGSDAGNNGTFTISAGDMYYDQHGGGMPDKTTFEGALVAMKEIHVDLPQTYESDPGKALGKYTVRRSLKSDGSKKIRKWKTT